MARLIRHSPFGDGVLRCQGRFFYSTKVYHDLKDLFWWEGLKKDIMEFVSNCPNFQQVKSEHQKPSGLLQEIQVPTWKLEDMNMDFVVGLPRTQRQYDLIWVVVDRLTKSAHFILVKYTYSAEDYARIFIDEIVCCKVFYYPSYSIVCTIHI